MKKTKKKHATAGKPAKHATTRKEGILYAMMIYRYLARTRGGWFKTLVAAFPDNPIVLTRQQLEKLGYKREAQPLRLARNKALAAVFKADTGAYTKLSYLFDKKTGEGVLLNVPSIKVADAIVRHYEKQR